MPADAGRVPAVAVLLTVVAGVTYSTFLLEHLLSPALDVVNGYVSELSAVDQPYHWVYRTGDLATGVLSITVAGIALIRLVRRPLATLGWAFFMFFGFGTIGDAAFPLDCAPSLATWCALRERADQVSFSHEFHTVTSTAVIAFGVLALFTLSVAARRYGWWPALARWGWLLAIAEAACALGTLGLMILGEWLGFMQRVQVGILCLGLFVIAWALYDDRRQAGRLPPIPVREKARV